MENDDVGFGGRLLDKARAGMNKSTRLVARDSKHMSQRQFEESGLGVAAAPLQTHERTSSVLRKRDPEPLDHVTAGGVHGRVLRVSKDRKQAVVEHSAGDVATYPLSQVEVIDDGENPLMVTETIRSSSTPKLTAAPLARVAGDMSDSGLDLLAKRSKTLKSIRLRRDGAAEREYSDGTTELLGNRTWGVIDKPAAAIASGPAAAFDLRDTGI